MLEDKMKAMLESAGKTKKELANVLGMNIENLNYWFKHVSGNFPKFYMACTLCGYKIKLRNRENPKDVIEITSNDVDEDEWTQYEKRSPYKKTSKRILK